MRREGAGLLRVALCTEGTWKKCVGLAPCQPPGPQAESSVQAWAPYPLVPGTQAVLR